MLSELRITSRALMKRPTYAVASTLVLAMLIASTTAVFSAVDAILLRPLPVRDGDALVALCEYTTKERDPFCVSTPPNAADLSVRSRTFEGVGQARDWPLTLRTARGGEGIRGGLATPGFFDIAGIPLALGRVFAPDEVGPGARVAIVSDAFARERFGEPKGAVGQALTLDRESFSIVGVLAADARVPTLEGVAVWVPLPFDPRDEENRGWRGFSTIARLKPGATLSAARNEIAAIATRLRDEHFRDNADWRLEVVPFKSLIVGSVSRGLTMLLLAIGLVVLIGCANLANLVLARTVHRRAELALRVAIGASRGAVMRTVLAESVVLALAGVVVGIPMSAWLVDALRTMAPPGLPRVEDIRFDLTSTIFAAGLGVVASALIGVVPALLARRYASQHALVEGGRGTIDGRSATVGRWLVGVQLAVACVLLTGGVLLTRSFVTLSRWDPGLPLDRALVMSLGAPQSRYPTAADAARLYERVAAETRTLPNVARTSTMSAGPLFGGIETGSAVRAESAPDAPGINTRWFDASPGAFSTLGRRLVRGRDFDERDRPGAPNVAVVNERLAAMLWPGENPIGRQLRIDIGQPVTLDVIGVVGDVAPMNPTMLPEPEVFWSNLQQPRWGTFLVIRTTSDPAGSIAAIRARLRDVDAELQFGPPATLSDLAARELVVPRFATLVVGGFGVLALSIAAVGLFGLQAYAVAQRRREFGVRIALGASPAAVRWQVIAQGLRTGAIALVAGLLLAQAVSRPIASLLAGPTARDPLTVAIVAITLAGVSLLGSLIPARRAARLEPMEALRSE